MKTFREFIAEEKHPKEIPGKSGKWSKVRGHTVILKQHPDHDRYVVKNYGDGSKHRYELHARGENTNVKYYEHSKDYKGHDLFSTSTRAEAFTKLNAHLGVDPTRRKRRA